MKLCAVVCEFNPFHNGHEYLLTQARQLSGCDAVLCVMSGNFTQRAEPSIVDKMLRTEFALMNGADFVVELPVAFSSMNGAYFSSGAMNIISQINGISHIAFGCECGNSEPLKTIASIQVNEDADFKDCLSKLLDDGLSYPKAYSIATQKNLEKLNFNSSMCDIILSKPNNLLAIEYIKQIIQRKLDIDIIAIKRLGADYNDKIIKQNYSSASALRQSLEQNDYVSITDNVPKNCIQRLTHAIENNPVNRAIFDALVIESLRRKDLEKLFDAGEGLEQKLKKNAIKFTDLDTIYKNTKSKRYTLARIKRLSFQALLNLTRDNSIYSLEKLPIKLLGVKNEHKDKIGKLFDNFIIQNKDYDKLKSVGEKEYMRLEKHAASLYGVITSRADNFYSEKLVVV